MRLVESGGANLIYQAEMFVEGGRTFANQARMSAAGIPQVTVVHGSSTAGGAYLPGLSDYVILVRGRAKVFLAGPPLLRAATGEIATDEELGGAEMHATVSGLGEYLAEDDADGIRIAREIMAKLPWNEQTRDCGSTGDSREPRYPADELAGVVPVDYRKPYDVRELIARIVDDSDFLDFKDEVRPAHGMRPCRHRGPAVGIHRQQRADRRRRRQQGGAVHPALLPGQYADRVFAEHHRLHGRDARRSSRGIIKHGSKMIQAVANATVPQLTIHVGASLRRRQLRHVRARLRSALHLRLAEQPHRGDGRRAGREGDGDRHRGASSSAKAGRWIARQLRQWRRRSSPAWRARSTALYATARLWDDGLIDPRDTRTVLGFCLSICREAETRPLSPSTFGVARM